MRAPAVGINSFTPRGAGGIIFKAGDGANVGNYYRFSGEVGRGGKGARKDGLGAEGKGRKVCRFRSGGSPGERWVNRKIKTALFVFIALSLITLAGLVVFHYKLSGPVTVSFEEDGDVSLRVEDIHYSGTKEGRLEWELEAGSATRTRKGTVISFENVSFVYYSSDGESYTLTAPEGTYDEATGVLIATGGVEISSEGGMSLRSPRMRYSTEEKRVTSADRVGITAGGMDVEGTGMVVELDRGRLLLERDVRAVIREGLVSSDLPPAHGRAAISRGHKPRKM